MDSDTARQTGSQVPAWLGPAPATPRNPEIPQAPADRVGDAPDVHSTEQTPARGPVPPDRLPPFEQGGGARTTGSAGSEPATAGGPSAPDARDTADRDEANGPVYADPNAAAQYPQVPSSGGRHRLTPPTGGPSADTVNGTASQSDSPAPARTQRSTSDGTDGQSGPIPNSPYGPITDRDAPQQHSPHGQPPAHGPSAPVENSPYGPVTDRAAPEQRTPYGTDQPNPYGRNDSGQRPSFDAEHSNPAYGPGGQDQRPYGGSETPYGGPAEQQPYGTGQANPVYGPDQRALYGTEQADPTQGAAGARQNSPYGPVAQDEAGPGGTPAHGTAAPTRGVDQSGPNPMHGTGSRPPGPGFTGLQHIPGSPDQSGWNTGQSGTGWNSPAPQSGPDQGAGWNACPPQGDPSAQRWDGYAQPSAAPRAPVSDTPAPGERRDPNVFAQQAGEQGGFVAPSPFTRQPDGPSPGWNQGAPAGPRVGPPQGGPPGAPPSLDDVPVRRAKKSPGSGWRKAVHHVSGGSINPGMSAEERRLQELVARIRQPVRGDYRIAVLSLKGGVGKTTTTMGLGSIFASVRGDRVIAVDANPDFGTLSQRVSLQTRSTVRDLLLDPVIERYSDVRRHTSQATSRLEVLASERDPAASEAFSDEEYRAVARILQRYYNIILTDCGTGLMHSAMTGVLDLAHSLVLVSSAAIDGARSAAATLDWLSLHGHDHLVRNAVVVINLPREGSPNVGIQDLRNYFLSRCRAVHIIPYDSHLSEGAEIDLHRLSKQAKRAYVELAATVADDFGVDHRRYH